MAGVQVVVGHVAEARVVDQVAGVQVVGDPSGGSSGGGVSIG